MWIRSFAQVCFCFLWAAGRSRVNQRPWSPDVGPPAVYLGQYSEECSGRLSARHETLWPALSWERGKELYLFIHKTGCDKRLQCSHTVVVVIIIISGNCKVISNIFVCVVSEQNDCSINGENRHFKGCLLCIDWGLMLVFRLIVCL